MTGSYFLVEDHALMRQGIIDYITKHSSYVCSGTAANTDDFLSQMSNRGKELPNILITDLGLGDDSKQGLSLIKTSRKQFPSIKIMVYSMYDDPGTIKAAMYAGADSYICKDSEEYEIIRGMEAVLQGRRYIDPSVATNIVIFEQILSVFTKREKEILNLIMNNKTNSEIAEQLGIQKRTVENTISRIYNKSGMTSREELRRYWQTKHAM
ncbi:MAG: response regulator transcription factor [Treponema sp.]|nr:response regulator transcription factor [Treponema sp.]